MDGEFIVMENMPQDTNISFVEKWLKNKRILPIILVLAVILAPLLYSISFIKSVWDPYAGASNLPIAVVNNDKSIRYNSKDLHVGKDIVDKLKKNQQLKWEFVSAEKANKGMKNRYYYTTLTIPENFSKNASTVLSKSPRKMQLNYKTNDSLNYLASTMSEMGVKQLNTQVRAAVTKAYTQTMFDSVKNIATGMNNASEGAKKLNEAMMKLKDGTGKYTAGVSKVDQGLQTLRSSIAPLTFASSQLAEGSSKLNNGIRKYTAGVKKLEAGSSSLTKANPSLKNGVHVFKDGVIKYTGGVSLLTNGLKNLSENSEKLRTGGNVLAEGSKNFGRLNFAVRTIKKQSTQFNEKLSKSGVVPALKKSLELKKEVADLKSQFSQTEQLFAQLSKIEWNKLSISEEEKKQIVDPLLASVGTKGMSKSKAEEIISQVTNSNIDATLKQSIIKNANVIVSEQQDRENSQINIGNAIAKINEKLSAITATTNSLKASNISAQIPKIANLLNNSKTLLEKTDGLLAVLDKNKDLLGEIPRKVKALSDGLEQVQQGSEKLSASAPQVQKLADGIVQYTNGADRAYNASKQINASSDKLTHGATTLADSINKYTNGVSTVYAGIYQLSTRSVDLDKGSQKLSDSLSQLNTKVPALIGGVTRLANGSSLLNSKGTELTSGVHKIHEGSSKLSTKLSEGAQKVSEVKPSQQNIEMFAEPTNVSHSTVSKVPNYGHALAPFVMSTGLFMGALLFGLCFPARRNLHKYNENIWKVFLKEFCLYAAISLSMVLVQSFVLISTGLKVENLFAVLFVSFVFSLFSVGLCQCLTLIFGRIGLLAGLIVLVMQIGGSGGMFPMPVINGFFNAINPLLPMTYAINGLRNAITGGLGDAFMYSNISVLVCVGFILYVIFFIALLSVLNKNRIRLTNKDTVLN